MIDIASARAFLDLMAEGEPVTFQTFDDNAERKAGALAQHFTADIDAAFDRLSTLNAKGAGVFWMVNYGDGKGRKGENVTGVRALFLDLDGAPLQPVLEAGVEPHAVVESSPGRWHVYWLVTGCGLEQFKPAQKALAARFGGDESVHDLPRVMRMPGFAHRKGQPFPTRTMKVEPRQPYDFEDLVQGLCLAQTPAESVAAPLPSTAGRVATGRNNHLTKWAAQMNWRGLSANAIRVALHEENTRACVPPLESAEVDDIARGVTRRYASQNGRDLNEQDDEPAELFRIVDMAQPERTQVDAWCWDGYMPPGHVTLLGGHGGAGKSTLGVHLLACMAMGSAALGQATKQARTLYFSGEDPASLVLLRLRRICHQLGLPFEEVSQWAQVIDATEFEPVLFTERRHDGVRQGITTPTYRALAEYIKREGFEVLIVDNASDVFDADEINRSMVRSFIRSLVRLVPSTGGVLLLAHVDKLTSRAGKQAGGESYSGSTAWHNSVRSRLFLLETGPGELELQHQKCNLGPKHAPLRLEWPQDGAMRVPVAVGGFVAALQSKADAKALLKLIHEFTQRGEFVAYATSSPQNATRILAQEKAYPKALKPAEVFALLRDAERDGWLRKDVYRDAGRKHRERWVLTDEGCKAIGVAPTAPTAPTYDSNDASKDGARGAPTAPTCGRGVRGDGARAQRVAQEPSHER